MGVLACDRRGCESIMCDRFSYEYQLYVCSECFGEMVAKNIMPNEVEAFMDTKKNKHYEGVTRSFLEDAFPFRD